MRNKRKEQKIFEIGTGELMKCKVDLEKIVQERYVFLFAWSHTLIASNTKSSSFKRKTKSFNAIEKP